MTITEALENQSNFSDSEKEIANFILKEKEKILEMSAHDICDATYTSTSSVVRLCRKIGLDGFKDFKIRYAAELERRIGSYEDIDFDFPIDETDSVLDVAQKMNVLMIDSLNTSYDSITRCSKELNNAVDLITRSRHTILVGAGDSLLKGYLFQSNMQKIKQTVISCFIPGEHLTLADMAEPGDCAIVISYSGNQSQTYEAVTQLKKRMVPIIAITGDRNSKIGKLSDIILEMPLKEAGWNKQANFSSQVATEYYLNVLYSCIYVKNYRDSKKIRLRTLKEQSHTHA